MSESSNREIVISFLTLVLAGKVREAYDKYVDQNFIHHNPNFKGDRESLLVAMEEDEKSNPRTKLVIKRVLVDGDFVITHSHLQQRREGTENSVVHIFQFEKSRIVEMWDIVHTIPKDSPNEHGMF